MDTRLPIQVTVASKCSQYRNARAHVGTLGMTYGPVVGGAVGAGGDSVVAGGAVLSVGTAVAGMAVGG